MDKEKYNKIVNKTVLQCWITISLVLVIAYIIEIIKGLRGFSYVFVFSIFTILPPIIAILRYNRKKDDTSIKYYALIGYIIFYTFSMVTTQEKISFVYIIPMISILIVYCDEKVTNLLYGYSIILNLIIIIINMINGEYSKADITFYEIQIACLSLSMYFTYKAIKLIKVTENLMFKLHNDIHIDELSKAYNRKYLTEYIIPNFNDFNKKNGLSIAFIDIDNFKTFNDAFGHEVGDEIIKKLSTHVIEKIKNKPHTKLVRYGGDEFILITYGIKYTDFINMCNEIHREIQNEKLDNINKKITLSIGVSNSLMEKSLDFFDLKDNADKKLYIAKNNGKNIIIC